MRQKLEGDHINKDSKVIKDFGDEWQKYDYEDFDRQKLKENFQQYFSVFPWHLISKESEGFDMGCGSGRWAHFVAPKVRLLNCVEPSDAIEVAKRNLAHLRNISYFQETTEECSIELGSQDFGYCLGVLHHIPQAEAALRDCAELLKPGAPMLVYLYYNFEIRPKWFRFLWRLSNIMRLGISRLPLGAKKIICEIIATVIYWPLAKVSLVASKLGLDDSSFPLADYARKPFYQMRNDSLDRFGTRIEQRFSKADITAMLTRCGFCDIKFSDQRPYWCCVAIKR